MSIKQQGYKEEFKQEVVLQIVRGDLTKWAARRRYKIGGKVTIDRWLYSYGYHNLSCIRDMPKSRKRTKNYSQDTELKMANLKIRFLEELINLAEQEYGVVIKKTLASGSKDPNKDK